MNTPENPTNPGSQNPESPQPHGDQPVSAETAAPGPVPASGEVPAAPTTAQSAPPASQQAASSGNATQQPASQQPAPTNQQPYGNQTHPSPQSAPQQTGHYAPGAHAPGTHAPGVQASGTYAGVQPPQPNQAPPFGTPQAGQFPQGAAFGAGAATTSPSAPRKTSRSFLVVGGIALAALIGGVSGAGITAAISAQNDTVIRGENGPQTITVNNTDEVSVVTGIAAEVMPSVVTISVANGSNAGSGSGVAIDDDGHILTNNHVITLDGESAEGMTIRVHTSDGRILPATVVGTDPMADLAVIKVEDANLPAVEFANSEKLNVGDLTVAIGAPLGLPGTVTSGVVSALNRGITVGTTTTPTDPENQEPNPSDPRSPWNFDLPGQVPRSSGTVSYVALPVIQTDASINPGNSGGPLLNSEGKLIGINVAIASTAAAEDSTAGSVGLGFAIPSNLAQRVADSIISGEPTSHGLLGATVTDSSRDANATVAGATLRDVSEGGAAAAAGLRSGDTIVKFNGIPITNSTDLTAQVRYLPGGSRAEVEYVRDGNTHTTEVTLGTLDQ
ncbi:trypsin-like peptidase domain-containing protein [Lysinibacter sp. HNR]|uniref:S1C family serine protease n=1 Tax=Lysinibacter sp. HNR TaxID=3031408 RepID=UPI002435CFED|nr:trypsin-like peptidase domain-containing protein [Lysinibacter sp. HNR]WGD38309.1 trypsin-like peptidase domain-containing protein [Lysinibacter sp. HNR]